MKEDVTNKIDDIEDAIRNTTAGQFRELSKAIQKLGVAMNAVPPYSRIKTNQISIFRIVKVAVVVMAIVSALVYFIYSMIK